MRKIMYAMLLIGTLGMTACQGKATGQGNANQGITATSETPQQTNEPVHTETPEQTEEVKETEKVNETEQPIETVVPEQTAEPKETKKPEKTEKPEKAEKPYYGSWEITSFKMGRVTAISTEDAQKLVGTTITYSKEKLSNQNDTITNPNYEENTETKETFEDDNRGTVTFDDLGVKGNSITAVVVPEVDTIGQAFFVINDNTIAIFLDGVYFIASKK